MQLRAKIWMEQSYSMSMLLQMGNNLESHTENAGYDKEEVSP